MRRVEPLTFKKQAAPINYVAGLGRGAIGFTTRSDIGPARGEEESFGKAPEGYVAGAGRGTGGFGEIKPTAGSSNTDGADYSETNYDKFGGFSGSLFAESSYDTGDKEADEAWALVEDNRNNKRKKRARITTTKTEPTRVADQFADLKQSLGTVSFEAWDTIPDSVTGVRAHKKEDRFFPVSDKLIVEGARSALNEERGRMIQNKLDSAKGVGGSLKDTDEYLSSLATQAGAAAPVGDIKKARLLFHSVTTSNPSHGPGWVAAARLEEVAGQLLDARRIIEEGCLKCSSNEDIWLEAARLNTPNNAKIIMANAIRHIPKSAKLWLYAAEIEGSDKDRQRRVFRRALEEIPNSEKLWKSAIELEDQEEDAKVLLSRAVECVPLSPDLWLALARLESYNQAKVVLNSARKRLPTEIRIWVAACALEENDSLKTDLVIGKAVKRLSGASNMIVDREEWLEQAKKMESSGALKTCNAIIRGTLHVGLEQEDYQRIWLDDAQMCEEEHHPVTARAIYTHALDKLGGNRNILMAAVAFETRNGDKIQLQQLLHRAVEQCPEAEFFWLMAAKEMWKTVGDVAAARTLLERAFAQGHNSERVWLAAVKLEWESGKVTQVRALLHKARQSCPTPRIWTKSVLFERMQLTTTGGYETVKAMLAAGTKRFPTEAKLWLMSAQLELYNADSVVSSRAICNEGLTHVPECTALWLFSARLELSNASVVRARSVLELARLKIPLDDLIWLESIRLERNHAKLPDMANSLSAKALKTCPHSGRLWAEEILSAPKPKQRAVSLDALQNCDENPHVFLALGVLFAKEQKVKVARKWFEKAVTADKDLGDAWARYFIFESTANPTAVDQLLARCEASEPKHGEIWQMVSKKDANFMSSTRGILKQVIALMNQ